MAWDAPTASNEIRTANDSCSAMNIHAMTHHYLTVNPSLTRWSVVVYLCMHRIAILLLLLLQVRSEIDLWYIHESTLTEQLAKHEGGVK